MKKLFIAVAFALFAAVCLSWGVTGHRTIAHIADRHLTPRARAAVHDLLGNESLADVSTWADEVRDDPAFRNTTREHFLNVPLGLSRTDFEKTVRNMTTPNVYSGLIKNEAVLQNTASTSDERRTALKFIVHFVGDMHQPMHVSRAEDKGGNTIQVRYDGKGTNLHALWDSKLLEHEGLNDLQMADQYDHLTQTQIDGWQKDPVIAWAWESYQISSQLYTEIEKPGGNIITDSYLQKYQHVIQNRLQQAGIRLAGLLNAAFKTGLPPGGVSTGLGGGTPTGSPASTGSSNAGAVRPAEGDSFCDVVYGGKYIESSGMTLLNLGAAYPRQTMTMVIYDKDRGKWKEDPLKMYDGKKICITGRRTEYKGKPEIIVSDPAQVKVAALP